MDAVGRLLAAPQCDPAAQEEEGNTPLMYAARGGHAAIAAIILDRPFVLVDKVNAAGVGPSTLCSPRHPLSFRPSLTESIVILSYETGVV